MKERLQKIISSRGVTSRRKAEQLISDGKVLVNGVAAKLGDRADPERDNIMIDGKKLPAYEKHIYLMLNKPRGYVTTLSDEKGRKNAASLVADCGVRVYPVGRLDMDSEGLILFTNDGDFANRLMHPKHEVEKQYAVLVQGYESGKESELIKPMEIDGYQIQRPEVRLLNADGNKAQLYITIHEGRNRQIRKMCEQCGMRVLRLRRVREGKLLLGQLPEGKWRYLTKDELELLVK